MRTIGFIGGGRITRILLQGFKNANISFEKISVYETNVVVLDALKSGYPQIDPSSPDAQQLHFPVSCTGGHLTLPKEQYTQQSPALGFNICPQFVHS